MKARDFFRAFSRVLAGHDFSKEGQAQTGRVLRVGTDVCFSSKAKQLGDFPATKIGTSNDETATPNDEIGS
jgi:hypothetical protein